MKRSSGFPVGWDQTAKRAPAHHCQTMVGRRSPKASLSHPTATIRASPVSRKAGRSLNGANILNLLSLLPRHKCRVYDPLGGLPHEEIVRLSGRVGPDCEAGAGPPLSDDGGPALAQGELVPPYGRNPGFPRVSESRTISERGIHQSAIAVVNCPRSPSALAACFARLPDKTAALNLPAVGAACYVR